MVDEVVIFMRDVVTLFTRKYLDSLSLVFGPLMSQELLPVVGREFTQLASSETSSASAFRFSHLRTSSQAQPRHLLRKCKE